jgi:hypothetical protein
MDRTAPGTKTASSAPSSAGTGSEFRFLAAGTSMERRLQAHARTAVA